MNNIHGFLNGFPAFTGRTIDKICTGKNSISGGQTKSPFDLFESYIFVQCFPDFFRAALYPVADLDAPGFPHPEEHFFINIINPGDCEPAYPQSLFDNLFADIYHPIFLHGEGII